MIANHAGDFRHVCEHVSINLRGAARHNDRRIWIILGRAANGLARGPHGFRRNRARIHNDRAFQSGFFSMSAHNFALIGVQATA